MNLVARVLTKILDDKAVPSRAALEASLFGAA